VRSHAWAGIEDISAYPLMAAWKDRMEARKGIHNGLGVPVRPKAKMTKEEEEEQAKEASKWVMKDHNKEQK
jgi:glutathione S-transferase